MSLQAELTSFLSAYQAVSGVQQKRKDSQQKGDYYNALIANGKSKIDLQQQSLSQRAESLRNSNAARWAGIGIQRDRLNVYKDSLKNKNPDFSQPPPGMGTGGGYFGSSSTSAVPTDDSTSPQPTSPSASQPGNSELPAGQEDTDETDDLDFAEGGEIPYADESAYDTGKSAERAPSAPGPDPATVDANAAAYDDGSNRGAKPQGDLASQAGVNDIEGQPSPRGRRAIDTEAKPGTGYPQELADMVRPDVRGMGTNSKTSGGFDQKEVLDGWRADPDNSPVHIGLKAISDAHSRANNTGAVQAAPMNHPGRPQGIDPATADEVKTAGRIIDPHGELNASSRRIAILDGWTRYYLARGDYPRAQKVASSLLVSAGMDAEAYGQAAVKAIQNGNTAAAVDFLKHAYSTIPNGHEFDAKILPDNTVHAYDVDTSTGDRRDLGAFGAAQVLQLARGVANGSAYWDQMVKLGSGMRAGQQKPQKSPYEASIRPADREKEAEAINTAANPTQGGKLAPEQTAPQGHENTVNNIAQQIYRYNNHLSPDGARRLSIALANPDLPKGTIQPQQDGSAIVQSNGVGVKVSPAALGQIMALQGMQAKAKKEADEKAAAWEAKKEKTGREIESLRSKAYKVQSDAIVKQANRAIDPENVKGASLVDLAKGVGGAVGNFCIGTATSTIRWRRNPRCVAAIPESERSPDPGRAIPAR